MSNRKINYNFSTAYTKIIMVKKVIVLSVFFTAIKMVVLLDS